MGRGPRRRQGEPTSCGREDERGATEGGAIRAEKGGAGMALLLSAEHLEQLLDIRSVIGVVEKAFAEYSSGKALMPVRTSLSPPGANGIFLVMPCALDESRALGTKLVSVYRQNPARGLPTIFGLYVLNEYDTGRPLAVMDASYITGIRTAAASAVATRSLARHDCSVLAIFGTGVQATFHLRAMLEVLPFTMVIVCGSSLGKTQEFVARHRASTSAELSASDSPEQAASQADVVVTATTSPLPLFSGDSLRLGTHVNAVGAHTPQTRELDTTAVLRSRVFADTYEGVLAEAGEVLIPMSEGSFGREKVEAELGEVVLGRKAGRLKAEEITLFKSVGAAFEDAATARLARDRAIAANVGAAFDF